MSTISSKTMTTAALRPLLDIVERAGFSSKEILAALGIDPCSVKSATQRISISHYDHLSEQISRLIDEPAIGLRTGQNLKMDAFFLLGFLIGGCSTPREALAVLRRYYALISDSRTPDFFIGQESVKVVFYVAEGSTFGTQNRAEFIASSIHSAGGAFGGSFYQLQEIGFRHPPPAYKDRLQKFFNAPILYNQRQNWTSFSAKYLDSPLSFANPSLFNMLRLEAEAALSKYGHLQDFSRRVMHILSEWPETVPMTKDAVAELLSTSGRTLTRRLQEEDCQFSSLVRDIRLKKASITLKETQTDVQQLAIDLGFSDRRGFERAFKQWTGMTPAAFRRENQTSDEEKEEV
ncbi:MAG: AraC family transcriptional regulator [Oleibacter sp.]|nr:AraC family transcriptional regulator [Thalassolituus sp.]